MSKDDNEKASPEVEEVRVIDPSAITRLPDGRLVVELPDDCTCIIIDGNG